MQLVKDVLITVDPGLKADALIQLEPVLMMIVQVTQLSWNSLLFYIWLFSKRSFNSLVMTACLVLLKVMVTLSWIVDYSISRRSKLRPIPHWQLRRRRSIAKSLGGQQTKLGPVPLWISRWRSSCLLHSLDHRGTIHWLHCQLLNRLFAIGTACGCLFVVRLELSLQWKT